MEKILTVVVPTYNAERYLRDNLESFCIAEILYDVEVLVINDGSTDHSLEIVKEYVKQYPGTYRVISKENGGHGSGINCGIQNATGKYFKVVDADDWVDQKAFIKLIKLLRECNSDVVFSGFLWAFDMGQMDKSMFKKKSEREKAFEGVEYGKEYRFDEIADKLYIKMHNLTIKTDILKENRISVDENCFYVDAEYIVYPIPYINTISFMKEFVYLYRIGRAGQSVGIEKMQRNEENYDRVIASLLAFFLRLEEEIPCSKEKRNYIASIIARVVAGKVKIMLSFPASRDKKREIQMFDEQLKTLCPEVYESNINKAVYLLRKSGFAFYYLASFLVRKKYH